MFGAGLGFAGKAKTSEKGSEAKGSEARWRGSARQRGSARRRRKRRKHEAEEHESGEAGAVSGWRGSARWKRRGVNRAKGNGEQVEGKREAKKAECESGKGKWQAGAWELLKRCCGVVGAWRLKCKVHGMVEKCEKGKCKCKNRRTELHYVGRMGRVRIANVTFTNTYVAEYYWSSAGVFIPQVLYVCLLKSLSACPSVLLFYVARFHLLLSLP
jgi:hypothetical protein